MQVLIEQIKEYFQLDQLLVPVVVYLSPKDNLPLLCDYVPLNVILAVINLELDSKSSLGRLEVSSYKFI